MNYRCIKTKYNLKMNEYTLITGATSGIGEACAEILAQNKKNLIITGRRVERLNDLEEKLKKEYGVKVHSLNFDIRNNDEVVQAINSLSDEKRNIEALINNAGLAAGLNTIDNGELDDWERMIDTNIKGVLYITKQITGIMKERKKGHIVNIGSIAGKEVYPNGNVYCATKHALDALNKGMRIDLLQHNIKVTAINPGMVETEFSLVRFAGDKEKADAVYKGFTPLFANDIAEAVWFALSRPAHVNINDLLIMPAAQASSTIVNKA